MHRPGAGRHFPRRHAAAGRKKVDPERQPVTQLHVSSFIGRPWSPSVPVLPLVQKRRSKTLRNAGAPGGVAELENNLIDQSGLLPAEQKAHRPKGTGTRHRPRGSQSGLRPSERPTGGAGRRPCARVMPSCKGPWFEFSRPPFARRTPRSKAAGDRTLSARVEGTELLLSGVVRDTTLAVLLKNGCGHRVWPFANPNARKDLSQRCLIARKALRAKGRPP